MKGEAGPVSFGVWWWCCCRFLFWGAQGASQLPGCETVRRRRRRLFLFWGGRGPVSFRAVKLFVVAVCFCFGAGGGPVSFGVWWCRRRFFFRGGRGGESASGVRSNGLCPQSVFAAGGLVPVGFKHSWLSTSHYLLEKHKLCDGDSLRVRGARAPARRRERG